MYNKQSYNITIVIYRVVGARKKYEHIICCTHPWSYYNFLLQKRWTICNVATHRCKELIKYMVQVFFLKIIVFFNYFYFDTAHDTNDSLHAMCIYKTVTQTLEETHWYARCLSNSMSTYYVQSCWLQDNE